MSMPDLLQIVKTNILASFVFIVFAALVFHLDKIPRSVLLLDGILCFLLICGARFATRVLREQYCPQRRELQVKPTRVLVVGAGDAGQMIAREIRHNPKLNLTLVGFIDDDLRKQKSLFQGVKVLGTQEEICSVVPRYNVDEVIIAIPSATGVQIRMLVEKCRLSNVRCKVLPGVGDLIGGQVSVQQVRDVDLNDLLGREPIQLDEQLISNYLRDKRVLGDWGWWQHWQ